jgi:hypothetical protein
MFTRRPAARNSAIWRCDRNCIAILSFPWSYLSITQNICALYEAYGVLWESEDLWLTTIGYYNGMLELSRE